MPLTPIFLPPPFPNPLLLSSIGHRIAMQIHAPCGIVCSYLSVRVYANTKEYFKPTAIRNAFSNSLHTNHLKNCKSTNSIHQELHLQVWITLEA